MRKLIYTAPLLFFLVLFTTTVIADDEELIPLPVIVIETEEPPTILEELEEMEGELQIEVFSEDAATIEEQAEEPDLDALLQDEEFLNLCATCHFEAGEESSLESKFCVCKVVLNRVNDTEKWGYTTISECVYAPRQFAVAHQKRFEQFKNELRAGNIDEDALVSINAALSALSGEDVYPVDPDVQFFNMDQGLSSWGGHAFAFEMGGNAFYYK